MAEKTIIKCSVEDQKLTVKVRPPVSSGGVNEVEVQTSFSSHWDGMAISLVAYDTERKPFPSLVKTTGEAVIRSEALAKPGTIQFGFIGVIDGEIVRTTTRINYSILLGLTEEDSTLIDAELTETMWQQILSELAVERAAYEAIKGDMDTVIAGLKNIATSVKAASDSASKAADSESKSLKSAEAAHASLDEVKKIFSELVNGEEVEY